MAIKRMNTDVAASCPPDDSGRLRSLKLPPLKGRSFMHVGCKEGFYCGLAIRAGAGRVVGTDISAESLKRAKELFPQADFLLENAGGALDELFDVVLFMCPVACNSTVQELVRIFKRAHDFLTPDGLLILEIAAAPGDDAVFQHPDGDRSAKFPTLSLVCRSLENAGLACRPKKWNISGIGEAVVVHCRRRKRSVIFIRGEYNTGKSYMTEAIVNADRSRVVAVDSVGKDVLRARYPKEPLLASFGNGIREIFKREPHEAPEVLTNALLAGINECFRTLEQDGRSNVAVVVDGLSPDREQDRSIHALLLERLRDHAVVWDARNLTPPEANWWGRDGPFADAGGYLLPINTAPNLAVVTSSLATNDGVTLTFRFHLPPSVTPLASVLVVNDRMHGKVTLLSGRCHFALSMFNPTAEFPPTPADLRQISVHIGIELSDHTMCFPAPDNGVEWPFRVSLASSQSS